MPNVVTGPLITDYTIAVDQRGLLRLVGQVSGHPRLGDTWLTTSPVWQLPDTGKHARSSGHWYQLADMRRIPDSVDGSERSRLIYGHCLTHEQASAHLDILSENMSNASPGDRT
ncbi:hypothetical protein Q4555_15650 [Octadecabacter sp. 1_MG-2023]|uniref:hypothetical protein n=1 Tax=unclassified Octadecabacter TaxID=196158 RepID=UPI001C0807D2|nr:MULTISPECIES: hypothetical protein [unclassified Octadecabacter]MBU2994034.1 hypothetical protein [Octadecabacter sp. B2R22]MDO6736113.1 hypothetical protein [Octadecabacter sp. 1_MG-2023]